MSYEKFIMDLDACGGMLKMLGGADLSDESFARASYAQAGPGQDFLSTDHTMAHFSDANFAGDVPESGPFETWSEAGMPMAADRATRVWQRMLRQHEPAALAHSLAEDLDRYVAQRRAALPEAWY